MSTHFEKGTSRIGESSFQFCVPITFLTLSTEGNDLGQKDCRRRTSEPHALLLPLSSIIPPSEYISK